MDALTAEEILKKATADLRELRSDEEQTRRTIDGLQARLVRVQREVESLENAIAVLRRYADGSGLSVERAEEQPILTPPQTEGMTISDMAHAILEMSGGTARTQTLIAELERLGKMRPGNKNNYNMLLQALSRRPEEFVRNEPGVWSLAPSIEARSQGRLAELREDRLERN